MAIKVSKLVSDLVTQLDQRQREVLAGRYGLADGNSKTLAEIGNKYGITRERVRQIEAGGLGALRAAKLPGLKEFINLVSEHLRNMGGLRQEDLLLSDLKLMITDPKTAYLGNQVRFLLEVAKEPKFFAENKNFQNSWYLRDEDRKKAETFISKLVSVMNSKRDTVVSHAKVDSLFGHSSLKPHNLKDLVALNFVSASKQFHVNEYGDFGLAKWPEVNPRTVRDWAYLVLKKKQNPLHFEEMATMINKVRNNNKKVAHPQTVHNELIKDERFVLVGRGIYGLQEFGLMPGTAKEVMGRILKENGPLKPKELLAMVLKERMFKKNTIFINLQNKSHFKKLEDGSYTTLA